MKGTRSRSSGSRRQATRQPAPNYHIIGTDIQAGKRAGVKTVGVKWSPKGYQLIEKENPDLLINDYKEFMEYIKENELC